MGKQVLLLPGYGNSGPEHWQSHWEKAHHGFHRVQQKDWESPRLADWLQAIDEAVDASVSPVVLVAHSLACLAVAHWGQLDFSNGQTKQVEKRKTLQSRVHAALLVAPPNPEAAVFPESAADFGPVPQGTLAFAATLVYSGNDPYAEESFSLLCARHWHCETYFAGALGHINSASRLDLWPQGLSLLQALIQRT